jgi:hypothetical protein
MAPERVAMRFTRRTTPRVQCLIDTNVANVALLFGRQTKPTPRAWYLQFRALLSSKVERLVIVELP